MIGAVAAHLLALPVWVALLAVFALPALESSVFVGFVFPGEIAVILGGVLAGQGRVSLAVVLTAAIAGAILGDSVGYAVGARYGRWLLDGTVGRFVHGRHLDRAERYLAERGGKAVLLGRFTASLRVLVPGLAGMSRLPYRTFLACNVAGAVGWASLSVLLGYLGGRSWRHAEHLASRVSLVALVVIVLAFVAGPVLRVATRWARRSLRRREVVTFLAVGGTGYVVDVVAFNVLRSVHPFSGMDPVVARTLAVAVAMVVTYLGNRTLTWPDRSERSRHREVTLFVVLNVIGFGFSLACLVLSHDVLGLTSRLADNISANVVGLGLGTLFRFATYRRFVFTRRADPRPVRADPRPVRADPRLNGSAHPARGAARSV